MMCRKDKKMEHKQIKISPRVIKHLGKDLITTSEVAIIELIKKFH